MLIDPVNNEEGNTGIDKGSTVSHAHLQELPLETTWGVPKHLHNHRTMRSVRTMINSDKGTRMVY